MSPGLTGTKMYYVYVIASLATTKLYVGHTDNLGKVLNDHNKGFSKFTSSFRPWTLIHSEEYRSKNKAKKREEHLKTRAGRKWLSEVVLKK